MIEIASGEYNVDMSKLIATAEKKYYEERDTYYLNTINRNNYISANTGKRFVCDLVNRSNSFEFTEIKLKKRIDSIPPIQLAVHIHLP